ncbi:Saccharopine dehydrogenase-domain-containing protein [Dichotomocladium elegans]|nr:Saccharopine dehydrogenase-domain-containing protein [Dichotomocladium elegans]
MGVLANVAAQRRTITSYSYVLRSGNTITHQGFKSLGIRREDKSRWERRTPLTPDAVRRLISETGTRVYVQPSTKRIFSDASYAKAGATLTEDLSGADVILGIKEVPSSKLLSDKTYCFFSHTHKGKPENMPMLKAILDKRIRLIDYELMKEPESGRRLVAFGKFAGNAGMVDGLHGMAHKFLGMGYNTPFMYMGMAHSYRTVASAKNAVRKVGNMIDEEGTPKDLGPLIFAFTGRGNVTQGTLEMFQELPHEFVPASDLPRIVKDKNPRLNKVYGTVLSPEDYIEAKSGGALQDYQDYLENPSKYESVFAEKIAPYVNSIITGAYWDQRYPRILTNDQLATIQRQQQNGMIGRAKLMSLVDIVCDPKGAVECLSHSTVIEDPFYYYDAVNKVEHKDVEKDGIQIMGIDILPAELPVESSEHFSDVLYPHIKDLIHPTSDDMNRLSPVLANAVIANQGKLMNGHTTLLNNIEMTGGHVADQQQQRQNILLLGSGMVARPLVERLTRRANARVVIASNVLSEAEKIAASVSSGPGLTETVELDISDSDKLARLISGADVVVSLVPAFLHHTVAKACIEQRKHMVTASYVSKEMEDLDEAAKKAGIAIMNEVGLDPGIDHMSAMKIIDHAKAHGKKIRSFVSWCGGLPAPEASNVPLGYKFSWSPRGVLTASGNDAIFWSNGKQHTIAGEDLLKNHFPSVRTPFAGFVFEGLANRDSLKYTDIYGLGNLRDMDTMFRGTLRYQGYSDLLYAFRKLGFLSQTETLQTVMGRWRHDAEDVIQGNLAAISDLIGLSPTHSLTTRTTEALQFLFTEGLHNDPQLRSVSALDALSTVLSRRLQYQQGERDMVAMQHTFVVESSRTQQFETITSTLISYGEPKGDTAMATTVGVPAALATELVLDNKIHARGVLRPTTPDIYLPILETLEGAYGIRFVEQVNQTRNKPLSEPTGSGTWSG